MWARGCSLVDASLSTLLASGVGCPCFPSQTKPAAFLCPCNDTIAALRIAFDHTSSLGSARQRALARHVADSLVGAIVEGRVGLDVASTWGKLVWSTATFPQLAMSVLESSVSAASAIGHGCRAKLQALRGVALPNGGANAAAPTPVHRSGAGAGADAGSGSGSGSGSDSGSGSGSGAGAGATAGAGAPAEPLHQRFGAVLPGAALLSLCAPAVRRVGKDGRASLLNSLGWSLEFLSRLLFFDIGLAARQARTDYAAVTGSVPRGAGGRNDGSTTSQREPPLSPKLAPLSPTKRLSPDVATAPRVRTTSGSGRGRAASTSGGPEEVTPTSIGRVALDASLFCVQLTHCVHAALRGGASAFNFQQGASAGSNGGSNGGSGGKKNGAAASATSAAGRASSNGKARSKPGAAVPPPPGRSRPSASPSATASHRPTATPSKRLPRASPPSRGTDGGASAMSTGSTGTAGLGGTDTHMFKPGTGYPTASPLGPRKRGALSSGAAPRSGAPPPDGPAPGAGPSAAATTAAAAPLGPAGTSAKFGGGGASAQAQAAHAAQLAAAAAHAKHAAQVQAAQASRLSEGPRVPSANGWMSFAGFALTQVRTLSYILMYCSGVADADAGLEETASVLLSALQLWLAEASRDASNLTVLVSRVQGLALERTSESAWAASVCRRLLRLLPVTSLPSAPVVRVAPASTAQPPPAATAAAPPSSSDPAAATRPQRGEPEALVWSDNVELDPWHLLVGWSDQHTVARVMGTATKRNMTQLTYSKVAFD